MIIIYSMTDKFKNKYRIPSARLQNWDYGWNGAYFITICTYNREHYFGEIRNGKMVLSNIGIIADILWHEIKTHSKNIDLGYFVVMPNHIHGIFVIDKPDNGKNDNKCTHDDNATVETLHATSLHCPPPNHHPPPDKNKNEFMAKISPEPDSVSTIIRSYKSAVTKHAHRLELTFKWQTRFYDHIIRNEKSHNKISEYIKNNPENWADDKFYNNKIKQVVSKPL